VPHGTWAPGRGRPPGQPFGSLGGGLKTEGWEQTDLKRETIDNEALPRTTGARRRPTNQKRSFPEEPQSRCSYDYDNTHVVTVIIQRIA